MPCYPFAMLRAITMRTLRDFAEAHQIYAYCPRCRHDAKLDLMHLAAGPTHSSQSLQGSAYGTLVGSGLVPGGAAIWLAAQRVHQPSALILPSTSWQVLEPAMKCWQLEHF